MIRAPVPDALAAALAAAGLGADARVGVACSGGADSTALAHAAMALCRAGGLAEVLLVHVDHGLRADAAADAARVVALGAAGGAAVRVLAVAVDGAASLEDAARRARYGALAAFVADTGVAAVLLGHTASDQAETVLMRLLRGTGVAGLGAIPPRRGVYLRPLLELPRAAIEAYLAGHGLDGADDPMNRDPRFLRSRIRHDLLPRLRAENPRLDEALGRLAGDAADQRAIADWAVATLLAEVRRDGRIDLDALEARAPEALVRVTLMRAAEAALGTSLSAVHATALFALTISRKGSRAIDLPGGRACREYAGLCFEPAGSAATVEPAAPVLDAPPGFVLRRWCAGDRMQPAALRGRSRKVSDLFIDAQVPRRIRGRALVLVGPDGAVAWVEHLGVAHGAAIDVTLTIGSRGATEMRVTARRL